ncbi:hypothetical protein [Streptomyces paludis]|uniref:Secreted protein n=1 Tax=Streptomyces paludis TaxID=2282738 RepID=A0A345HQP9_9ACTN|nr:hypothetical protein [Streptomyces paludis]AXG79023.1 hypothetical protein DVK44_16480 [Streptomyces paludis]
MPTSRAALTALTLALALSLTLPAGTAAAASGTFTYTPRAEPNHLLDPGHGCYPAQGGTAIDNQTDREIWLFTTPNCAGTPATEVEPYSGTVQARFGSMLVVGPATGLVIYYVRSPLEELVDPPSGVCQEADGEGTVINKTNATALLYEHPGCPGTQAYAVSPGSHLTATFKSVKFVD